MHCTKVHFAKIYSGVNIFTFHIRAAGRAENPGVPVSFGGNNLPSLVGIGLTDPSKLGGGGGQWPPWPPGSGITARGT